MNKEKLQEIVQQKMEDVNNPAFTPTFSQRYQYDAWRIVKHFLETGEWR